MVEPEKNTRTSFNFWKISEQNMLRIIKPDYGVLFNQKFYVKFQGFGFSPAASDKPQSEDSQNGSPRHALSFSEPSASICKSEFTFKTIRVKYV